MRHALLVTAAALALAGCAISSQITRSSGKAFAPRDASCNVEFFRTQRPALPYDEIAAIHLSSGVIHGPDDAQEKLRGEACALGGDAVIITEELYQVPNVGLRVTGTAVKYKELLTAPATPPSQEQQPAVDAGTP